MFVAERDGAYVDAEDEAVAEVQEQSDHGGEGPDVSTAGNHHADLSLLTSWIKDVQIWSKRWL